MSRTPLPPCHGQTEDLVKAWLTENVRVGATVAVRHTQGGFLMYSKAKVVRIGIGRFEVDSLGPGHFSQAGLTFYYSGKNCVHPKGQTRIVVPTEAVLAASGKLGKPGSGYQATTV